MNYYNEFDSKAAAWIRELIKAGEIPAGHVDERSIKDVKSIDLLGYKQCHFFGGVAGWPLTLRLAGWPEDRTVWTMSCPCQPFSCAGKGAAQDDPRHLWPQGFRLIRECRPQTVFGEQVASTEVVGTQLEAAFVNAVQSGDFARANRIANALIKCDSLHFHRRWLDGISADLASAGYAGGATIIGAHSVGAPHKRQRLYWVADNQGQGRQGVVAKCTTGQQQRTRTGSGRTAGALGQSNSAGRQPGKSAAATAGHREAVESASGHAVALGDSIKPGLEGLAGNVRNGHESRRDDAGTVGPIATPSPWSDFQIIQCRDGKARRIPAEPEFFPLAHGIPGRVGLLRGYGNAIVPQVAAEFITAYLNL